MARSRPRSSRLVLPYPACGLSTLQDDVALRGYVEATFGEVRDLAVIKTDLVNDTTLISMRRFPASSLRGSVVPSLKSTPARDTSVVAR